MGSRPILNTVRSSRTGTLPCVRAIWGACRLAPAVPEVVVTFWNPRKSFQLRWSVCVSGESSRCQAGVPAGPNHADGDLSAVRDEHLVQTRHDLHSSGKLRRMRSEFMHAPGHQRAGQWDDSRPFEQPGEDPPDGGEPAGHRRPDAVEAQPSGPVGVIGPLRVHLCAEVRILVRRRWR